MNGICTLANDRVYDQLVALLNSIDAILGSDTPVCIYPFDNQLEKVKQEVARRSNVQLYDNSDSIRSWDEFMFRTSPHRQDPSKAKLYGAHRRFCAFDGPFERFIYMDADTLAMNSLDPVFKQLDDYDWVVYDFQHKEPQRIYNFNSDKLLQVFPLERIQKEVFCSGFFASKKGMFNQEQRDWLSDQLSFGHNDILYVGSSDQPVLNYMVMRSNLNSCNLAYVLPESEVTGCCVTSSHFTVKNNIVYDQDRRLTYLHYIGVPPHVTERICQGENIAFPYREVFLHYRYLYEPEKRPKFILPGKNYKRPPLLQRVARKLHLIR